MKAATTATTTNKKVSVVNKTVAAKQVVDKDGFKVKNTIPFVLNDKTHFATLWDLFNRVYVLKLERIPGLTRASLFNSLYNDRLRYWQSLEPTDVGTQTPFSVLEKYGKDLHDMLVGDKVAAEHLAAGKARAFRISESKSTGVSTYAVTKVLPISSGDANIVKSLAKKQTGDGKLFGIEERDKKTGIMSLTVYRVRVEIKPVLDDNNQPVLDKKGNPVLDKKKIATKESKSIRRMNKSESAFKKGLSAGLAAAV